MAEAELPRDVRTEPPAANVPALTSNECRKCIVLIGTIFGASTLLFFMVLVVAAISGYAVPPNARFLVIVVLALGGGTFVGLTGHSAAIQGKIPLPFAREYPVVFSAAGGTAVFLMCLLFGYWLYINPTAQAAHVLVPVPSNIPEEFRIKNLSSETIKDIGEVRTINGDRFLYVEFRQGQDKGNLSLTYPKTRDREFETLTFQVDRESTITRVDR